MFRASRFLHSYLSLICAALVLGGCRPAPSADGTDPHPEVHSQDTKKSGEIDKKTKENLNRAAADQKEAADHQEHVEDPETAMSAPGMGDSQIPIDRSLFDPFHIRDQTPDQIEFRTRALNALWKTPLGQMFFAYLKDDVAKDQVISRGRQFVTRIFSEGRQVSTRIMALQLLSDDLYARSLMTTDMIQRAFLLEGEISNRRIQGSQETQNGVVYQAAIFFLASLPFGSPLVRAEAKKGLNAVGERFRNIFRRGESVRKPFTDEEHVAFKDLFTLKIFEDYKISHAANFFFATYGPYSMSYFFWNDWLKAATGFAVNDKLMLDGLDQLLRAASF